jgi:hypothetical protein
MKKSALILILNILLLQGCGIFGGDDTVADREEQTTPTPSEQQASNGEKKAQEEEESDLLETSTDKGMTPSSVATGLIPSVNPQTRQQQAIKRGGKNDPFGSVPVQPVINVPPPEIATDSEARDSRDVRGEQDVRDDSTKTVRDDRQEPYSDSQTSKSKYCHKQQDGDPIQPVEAKAVLVSGVIDVEGEHLAIIKTPEYNYSYTVKEGSNIYGGQVLVKQIDTEAKSPVVILEQYGRDVIRRIGEQPQEASTPPLGADGFGRVRNLVLLQVETQNVDSSTRPIVEGVFCNDNDMNIKVSSIDIQVEEKQTKEIISSLTVDLGTSYLLQPGQKGIFDGTIGFEGNEDQILGLRGRNKENLNFVMVDWR